MTKTAIPMRLQTMTHEQKARRIMELEDALQQTNDRIAAAVLAERERCAKVAHNFSSKTVGTMRDSEIAAAIRALK